MLKLLKLAFVAALACAAPVAASAQISTDAYQGVIPAGGSMTLGTVYPAGRGWAATCTVAGNASVTFRDGTTLILPLAVGLTIFHFAVVSVNTTGTTATCTYANLR